MKNFSNNNERSSYVLLGVDGGGTKTEFAIMDDNKKILARYQTDTIHHLQVSLGILKRRLQLGVNTVCKKAKINPDQIKYAFLGLAGYEVIKDIVTYKKTISSVLKEIPFECSQDIINAWAGALNLKQGVVLIAGTGSVSYGVYNNVEAVCGGWGPTIGDEGSAYYIALKLLKEFSKQADNRKPKTAIYKILKETLNIEKDSDIINLIHKKYNNDRTKIAKLSKIVSLVAKLNCKEALSILDESAYELAQMAIAVIKELNLLNRSEILVSYVRGIFNADKFILQPLEKYLKNFSSKINIIKPYNKPVVGACLYAYELSNNK